MNGDVLIIGSGIAGLSAAYELSKSKIKVVVLTRAEALENCNSNLAQGGIVYEQDAMRNKVFYEDIMEAGAHLSNPKIVNLIATSGNKFVKEILIDQLSIHFDCDETGNLAITQEGAHRQKRIIYSGDETGRAIMASFIQVLKPNPYITFLTDHSAIDLITLSHHSTDGLDRYQHLTCCGAYVFNSKSRQVETILAKEVILATGGLGNIYLHSTNGKGARGDGISMAFRAGARIMNLEYVQFHPTTFYRENAKRFLISEALRGEGARLIDHQGNAFMARYDNRQELAPRDVVSRAIHSELLASGQTHVFLDISHKPRTWLSERFPYVFNRCQEMGVDISREPIPVVPAAHYTCGGVFADEEGTTNVARLSAVGEVACTGLHGANRLASTSLLEGLVCGTLAARKIVQNIAGKDYHFPQVDPWTEGTQEEDPALIAQDWSLIQQTMWNYVGLVRTRRRLLRAQMLLAELGNEIERFYKDSRLTDGLIGLRNASLVSQLVVKAALQNKVSRGCHFRLD